MHTESKMIHCAAFLIKTGTKNFPKTLPFLVCHITPSIHLLSSLCNPFTS